jgi:hypothetical protein
MVNLETAAVADSMPFLRLHSGTPKFRIYQAVPGVEKTTRP